VAPVELEAGLQADAAVLRHRQRLQAGAVDLPAQRPHLQAAQRAQRLTHSGSRTAHLHLATLGAGGGVTLISYLSALRRM